MNISTKSTFNRLTRDNHTLFLPALLSCLLAINPGITLAENLNTSESLTRLKQAHSNYLKASGQPDEVQTEADAESDDCD